MIKALLKQTRREINRITNPKSSQLKIEWFRKNSDSYIASKFEAGTIIPPRYPNANNVERLAVKADRAGRMPLWEGYKGVYQGAKAQDNTRSANQVSTDYLIGSLFASIVIDQKPSIIVEFGTAFGVSGMYWLLGLEQNHFGKLLTFEPNDIWAKVAHYNLSEISNRFELIEGTFEDNIELCLRDGEQIDMAFIDAIHTSEFVFPQFEIVVSRTKPKGLILFDDINFTDDMKQCWEKIAYDNRVKASASIAGHTGIVELY